MCAQVTNARGPSQEGMMSIEQDRRGRMSTERIQAERVREDDPAMPDDPVMSAAEVRELGRRLKAAILRDAAAHAESDRDVVKKDRER